MTEQGANGGKPKRSGLSKAFEIALDVISADGYGTADIEIEERHFGDLRIKQWGKFARKQGLDYRDQLDPQAVGNDAALVAMFEELRTFGLPLNAVGGLMRGRWHDCDLVSFHTYSVGERGNIGGYRMACAPLARRSAAFVFDKGMQYEPSGGHDHWYAALSQYSGVAGPKPPSSKKPGLLARTPVGKKLGDIFAPLPPKIWTDAPDSAERFFASAYRQYDERAFKYDWAVTGSWLVVHHFDGQTGLMANGKASAFLDTVTLLKRLVEQS